MATATKAKTYGPETLLTDYALVYQRLKLGGSSDHCRRQYESNMRCFCRWFERPATLADLTDDNLVEFMGWLQNTPKTTGDKRSPATVNKIRSQIVALWRFAARKGHVATWPDVDKVQEFKRIPTSWTPEEVARLLATIRAAAAQMQVRPCIDGIPSDDWWIALLLTVYDTGARIGAVMSIRTSDFNRDARKLLVRAETQKQKADQLFILSEETAAAIAATIDANPDRELLFPWPLCRDTLWHHYRRLLVMAGLPATRRDKFHKLRRTSATLCELHVGRGSATFHLGHSSPLITAAYIDPTALPESAVATKFPRPPVADVTLTEKPGTIFSPYQNRRTHRVAVETQMAIAEWPIAALVNEYRDNVLSVVESGKHIAGAYRLATMLKAIDGRDVSQLDAGKVLAFVDRMRAEGQSTVTVKKYRQLFTRFVRWLVDRKGRDDAAECLAALKAAGKAGDA